MLIYFSPLLAVLMLQWQMQMYVCVRVILIAGYKYVRLVNSSIQQLANIVTYHTHTS